MEFGRFVFVVSLLTAATAATVTYEPTWESLDTRPNPAWYEQSRFGIKIHWGPYAVPSYGALGQYAEQYARFYRVSTEHCGTQANPIRSGCKTAQFHQRAYGKTFKYEQFASQFNPVLYNASHWADVFRRGGAKYVYMTAKHSDGFAMWPSVYRHGYNSMATIGRDLLGELMDAIETAGLRKGIFYEMEDYFNFGCSYDVATVPPSDTKPNTNIRCPWGGSDEGFPDGWAARYVNSTLIPELMDLVTRYHPDYLYADGDWSGSDDFLQTKPFLAWLFNLSPVKDRVVINDRWGNTTRTHHGGTYLCEYDPTCKFDHPFAVTQGFGKSFGYNRLESVHTGHWCDWNLRYGDGACPVSTAVTQSDTDRCCTSTNTTGLVHLLVRTVAKSGNLEINFGPDGDGRLPTEMVQPLLGTGRWLQVNGEAIYNTTGFPFGRSLPECDSDTASTPAEAEGGSGSGTEAEAKAKAEDGSEAEAEAEGGAEGGSGSGTKAEAKGEGEAETEAGAQAEATRVDKCFTTRGRSVYVLYLHWPHTPGGAPHTRLVTLDHLKPTVNTTVTLLGAPSLAIPHRPGGAGGSGMEFEVPDQTPDDLECDQDLCHAFVFKVTDATPRVPPASK